MFGQESNPNSEIWQPTAEENIALSINLFSILVQTWACFIYVFIRRGFGESYFSIQAVCVVPLMLVHTNCMAAEDPGLLNIMTLAWVAALVFQRFAQGIKNKQLHPHSRYNGYPILCNLLSVTEETAKE